MRANHYAMTLSAALAKKKLSIDDTDGVQEKVLSGEEDLRKDDKCICELLQLLKSFVQCEVYN